MSQYGLPFDYDEPWVSGAMDLSIETLTGTAFEIRVVPTDTIMSIKTKIQRVEGIPVSQQHLLYNLVELDNSASVQDYAIQNGATLKLILSMRGGPISTRRLPQSDEALWREVQEWLSDGRRDDRTDRVGSASKTSILVFRDGDSFNLFHVVENDDGTYSPLAQSWSASSVKNVFAEDDPVESDRRSMENWVTMGKMQELKGKLEKLSITRKDKKSEDGADEDDEDDDEDGEGEDTENLWWDSEARVEDVSKPGSSRSFKSSMLRVKTNVNDGASCSNVVNVPELSSEDRHMPPLSSRPVNQTFFSSMSKARKEAENIIRLQSKSLSVVVDSHSFGNHLKRTPLPEIRRSARPEKLADEKLPDDDHDDEEKNEMRSKTENRMSASRFAIVQEESDMAAGPSICSSQSSLLALPSNDDVVVAFSPISRGHGSSSSLRRSRFRVSSIVLDDLNRPKRIVLENSERPKTTPTKHEQLPKIEPSSSVSSSSSSKKSSCSKQPVMDLAPTWYHRPTPQPQRDIQSNEKEEAITVVRPSPSNPPQPEPPKKRPRCIVCKKRLNITNTHTCRCSGIFCSIHRYSETHDCHFDYKEEGKHLLRLSNPLVTAPKLPKI